MNFFPIAYIFPWNTTLWLPPVFSCTHFYMSTVGLSTIALSRSGHVLCRGIIIVKACFDIDVCLSLKPDIYSHRSVPFHYSHSESLWFVALPMSGKAFCARSENILSSCMTQSSSCLPCPITDYTKRALLSACPGKLCTCLIVYSLCNPR